MRSGGFGLVVLDLAGHRGDTRLPPPLQSRLGGLAQKHDAALVVLTEKLTERASLGALVSLRAEARREGRTCVVRALKDKRRGPSEAQSEICRLPDGLPVDPPAGLSTPQANVRRAPRLLALPPPADSATGSRLLVRQGAEEAQHALDQTLGVGLGHVEAAQDHL